jgi:hypothetical protein
MFRYLLAAHYPLRMIAIRLGAPLWPAMLAMTRQTSVSKTADLNASEPNLPVLCRSFANTNLASFRWRRGRQCGKADTPQQVLEPSVVTQAVHARIYMKIDKPVGVFFVGFLQIFQRPVVFSQADMDSGEEVGCDILLLG